MTTAVRLQIIFLIATVSWSSLSSCPKASIAGELSLDDVRREWENREKGINSAWFIWDETEFARAHTKHKRVQTPSTRPLLLPTDDVTLERSVQLAISGHMMRYAYEGQVFNANKGGVRDKQYISVFDGTVSKNFHRNIGGEQEDYPLSGFVREESVHYDSDNRNISPILIHIRPCSEEMGGVSLDAYKMGTTKATINGHTCLAVQPRTESKKRWGETYWVDPVCACIVRRIAYGQIGNPPAYTIDIDYDRLDDREWVPSGWKLIDGDATRIISQISGRVKTVRLNENIANSEFRLQFPPGTAVVDNRTGERLITKDHGQPRIVTNAELARGATYQELVSTETGKAALPRSHNQRRLILLAFACAGLLVTISFFVWIRGRQE